VRPEPCPGFERSRSPSLRQHLQVMGVVERRELASNRESSHGILCCTHEGRLTSMSDAELSDA